MKDYKNTLFMPKTPFEMRGNLNNKEPLFQKKSMTVIPRCMKNVSSKLFMKVFLPTSKLCLISNTVATVTLWKYLIISMVEIKKD